MKASFLKIVLLITSVYIMGCSTTPVPFSFAGSQSDTAAIIFTDGNPGIKLIYFEGNELPEPEAGTHWQPISFPARRTFRLTLYAYYRDSNSLNTSHGFIGISGSGISVGVGIAIPMDSATRNVNGDVIFECPPLEASKEYKLTFRKGAGVPGRNMLVLTDISTGQVVHEQEFKTR